MQSSQQQSIPQQENENQHQHQQSDLNASSVKEFVPGKAWSSQDRASTLISKASDPAPQEGQIDPTQRHHGAASIPAGPTPSPLPSFRSLQSMGSDALWRYHRELSLESNRQMDPTDPRHNAVPMPYYNAFCLDLEQNSRSSSFGYPSSTFSTTSRQDGHLYTVRRFDNVRCVSPRIADAITKKWTNFATVQEHPGVVPLYNCFVAQRAVFFVHRYIPGARTLRERLLEGPLHETFVWSAVNQVVSAVRAIHSQNLAVRALDVNHILTNTNADGSRLRLRLNCLGVVDALEFEARKNPTELQLEDIRNLGFLVLSIATSVPVNPGTDQKTLGRYEKFMGENYSRELHGLTMTLIKSARPPSILEIGRALALRTLDEQDAAYISLDRSDKALSAGKSRCSDIEVLQIVTIFNCLLTFLVYCLFIKEFESGRILRLMVHFVDCKCDFQLWRSLYYFLIYVSTFIA